MFRSMFEHGQVESRKSKETWEGFGDKEVSDLVTHGRTRRNANASKTRISIPRAQIDSIHYPHDLEDIARARTPSQARDQQ